MTMKFLTFIMNFDIINLHELVTWVLFDSRFLFYLFNSIYQLFGVLLVDVWKENLDLVQFIYEVILIKLFFVFDNFRFQNFNLAYTM